MTIEITVFLHGEIVMQLAHEDSYLLRAALITLPEWRDHAFIFVHTRRMATLFGPERGWYRGDWTPFPEDQVPKELRVLLLLYS